MKPEPLRLLFMPPSHGKMRCLCLPKYSVQPLRHEAGVIILRAGTFGPLRVGECGSALIPSCPQQGGGRPATSNYQATVKRSRRYSSMQTFFEIASWQPLHGRPRTETDLLPLQQSGKVCYAASQVSCLNQRSGFIPKCTFACPLIRISS